MENAVNAASTTIRPIESTSATPELIIQQLFFEGTGPDVRFILS